MSEVMVWSTYRDKAVEAFEGFPSVNDEVALIDAFERAPVAVVAEMEKTIDSYKAGKIRRPWLIWLRNVEQSRGDVSVSAGPDREARVGRAQAWIDHAGLYCDRAGDVELELFGDTIIDPYVVGAGNPRAGETVTSSRPGMLGPWAGDRELRDRMVEHWRGKRSDAERVELQADERQTRHGHELRARGWPAATFRGGTL